MAEPRKFKIIAAFAALYLIWGSTYLGILFAIQSVPPFLMAGARFFLAGLIMFAIARIYITLIGWIVGMTPRPKPIVWLGLAGGFLGVAVLLGPALRFSGEANHHPAIGMSILLFSSF